jgi:hypothetical protein
VLIDNELILNGGKPCGEEVSVIEWSFVDAWLASYLVGRK